MNKSGCLLTENYALCIDLGIVMTDLQCIPYVTISWNQNKLRGQTPIIMCKTSKPFASVIFIYKDAVLIFVFKSLFCFQCCFSHGVL